MKIISEQECQEWLKTKLSTAFSLEAVMGDYTHRVSYQLPNDTGKKTVLARVLTGSIDTEEPGLFWITAWGIFPSSENMALFDGYRKSLGDSRPIHAAPGHIFDKSDLQQLECLFDLALYFNWDATLFCGTRNIVIRTSHDEYISVYGRDKARVQELESTLGRLKLTQLAPTT